MPPAARPGICSAEADGWRGAAQRGADTGVSTIPRARASPPGSHHAEASADRPLLNQQSSRAPGQLLIATPHDRDSGRDLGVAVLPHGVVSGRFLPLTGDPGRLRGFREAASGCSQNRSPQRSPANGLRPTAPRLGLAPAGPGAHTLSRRVNSPAPSAVTSGAEQPPPTGPRCTTAAGRKPAREPALPAAASSPAPAAPG